MPYNYTERNLWKQNLPKYDLEHVAAKFNLIKNPNSVIDQAIFEPIKELGDELNEQDLLLISTPMWNLTVPYILKNYIDMIIQPGTNRAKKFIHYDNLK